MSRAELETILLAMLLDRAKEENPLAQALADVALVRKAADVIIRVGAAGTEKLLRDLETEILATEAQRPGGVKA